MIRQHRIRGVWAIEPSVWNARRRIGLSTAEKSSGSAAHHTPSQREAVAIAQAFAKPTAEALQKTGDTTATMIASQLEQWRQDQQTKQKYTTSSE
jgi:S1-C subfamily serine protease